MERQIKVGRYDRPLNAFDEQEIAERIVGRFRTLFVIIYLYLHVLSKRKNRYGNLERGPGGL